MISRARWLCPATLFATALLGGAEFAPIFDGKSLDGWTGDRACWRVENGAIVGETRPAQPSSADTQLWWQGAPQQDFELKFEFKVRNHIGAVLFRSQPATKANSPLTGYQAGLAADAGLNGTLRRVDQADLVASAGESVQFGQQPKPRTLLAQVGVGEELRQAFRKETWNEGHLIAYGNHVILLINGTVTAEFFESATERLRSGGLGLALTAGTPMQAAFRNLRLRPLSAGDKKLVVFLAGPPSHGYGTHEHRAGSVLLAKALNESGLDVLAEVRTEVAPTTPWPLDATTMASVSSVVMYCDGNDKHIAAGHEPSLQKLVDRGVGLACLHYAVEVNQAELGARFLDWMGGYFENGWSVNPHWTPQFDQFPSHPAARAMSPFSVLDEWYYHLRFLSPRDNLVPLLTAVAPLKTLQRTPAHSRTTNPNVRASVERGEPQTVAWAYTRPAGGRSFGFTGGHFHDNWREPAMRRVVLNGIVWTAGMDVPAHGVPSQPVSDAFLALNQDSPPPKR